MFASIFKHWQSTLFGFLQGVAGALLLATQHQNLTWAQFWTVLVASVGAALKGAVSADASQVEASK